MTVNHPVAGSSPAPPVLILMGQSAKIHVMDRLRILKAIRSLVKERDELFEMVRKLNEEV